MAYRESPERCTELCQAARVTLMAMRGDYPIREGCVTLCEIWNSATSPSALRTDAEHDRMARLARICKAAINRRGIRYSFNDHSGRMYLV